MLTTVGAACWCTVCVGVGGRDPGCTTRCCRPASRRRRGLWDWGREGETTAHYVRTCGDLPHYGSHSGSEWTRATARRAWWWKRREAVCPSGWPARLVRRCLRRERAGSWWETGGSWPAVPTLSVNCRRKLWFWDEFGDACRECSVRAYSSEW